MADFFVNWSSMITGTAHAVANGGSGDGILSTRSLVEMAFLASLTAAGGMIRVPIPPVPITLQTLFVYIAGGLLGSRRGAFSQLLFLGVGLSGIPVFSMGGGLGYVFQPTFGYVLSFPLGAWVVGRISERGGEGGGWCRLLSAHAAGLVTIHAAGVAYLFLVLNVLGGENVSWARVVWSGSLLFLPGEAVKMIASILVIRKLRPLRSGGWL